MIRFFSLLCMMLFSFSCQSQSSIDKSVVPHLSIEKYVGTWYEIARYDHSFERNLVGVTATYSLKEDGMIKVVNAGYKNTLDGKYSSSEGKAKVPNPPEGKLKVSFFWIFYGDYFVLDIDPKYQWAIVGSSSDKYLWILSRTPQLDDSVYNDLIDRISKRGYDASKLIKVPQKVNK